MTAYVAEVFLPEVTEPSARDAARRLRQGAARLAAGGIEVRFLGVTLIVEDQALLCRWESGTEEAVRAVHQLSGVGPVRLLRSVDIGANDEAATSDLRPRPPTTRSTS